MTRHTFGATLADYVIIPGDADTVGGIDGNQTLLVPDRVVTFYDASTAGTLLDDLLDLLDTPIVSVTTDSAGSIPAFQGPDDDTRAMWADANGGAGPRALMVATDLGADLAVTIAAAAAAAADIAALAPVAVSGEYSDLTGAPALADVATTGDYEDLVNAPAPGLQYVSKIGGTWPVRASTAPDAARPAVWLGPAPAPPATAGYALASDVWFASPA